MFVLPSVTKLKSENKYREWLYESKSSVFIILEQELPLKQCNQNLIFLKSSLMPSTPDKNMLAL